MQTTGQSTSAAAIPLGSPSWRHLLIGAGAADLVIMAVTGVALRDTEALAFTAGIAVGLGLLRVRRGRLGTVLLGLLLADVAVWMVPAALSNLRHGEDLLDAMIPAALAAASLAGIAGLVGELFRRGRRGRAPIAVALGAVALLVGALGWTVQSDERREALAGDVSVETENVAFSITEIAADGGRVSVRVTNRDLFWHTFTIGELGVNVAVPTGGTRRTTFTAAPGRYEFVCAIPGHAQAGMKGTMVLR